jgi:hypothetical protein
MAAPTKLTNEVIYVCEVGAARVSAPTRINFLSNY